ncbi:MAG: GAF domain-containing protein, partial [Actinobacteria bacterium]|nr:GAF domain-containing protein [Actinomycetota bacterium]
MDESGDELVCAGTWSAEPSLAEFSEVTWLQSFRRGEGLPGQVWERNAPVWSAEAPSEPFFVRNEAAREVGLRTGVGLPLVSEGRTIGTIGFFSRRAQQADPEVLDLMSRLGRQLGEFFARRRSEEERQAMERRLLESQKRESLGVLAGGIA